jgi:hypothetical protein
MRATVRGYNPLLPIDLHASCAASVPCKTWMGSDARANRICNSVAAVRHHLPQPMSPSSPPSTAPAASRDLVFLTKCPTNAKNFARRFAVVVDVKLKLSCVGILKCASVYSCRNEISSSSAGDISPFDFLPVSDQVPRGPPQSGGENGKENSSDGGKWTMVRISEISGTSHQDLSISPDPLEREGTFLVLLIGGILLVMGLAGLK